MKPEIRIHDWDMLPNTLASKPTFCRGKLPLLVKTCKNYVDLCCSSLSQLMCLFKLFFKLPNQLYVEIPQNYQNYPDYVDEMLKAFLIKYVTAQHIRKSSTIKNYSELLQLSQLTAFN